MNKKHSLYFGVAVLLLAAIFTLAGCDNGGPESSPYIETFISKDPVSGYTYTLEIIDGGSYTLTITASNGTLVAQSTGAAVENENENGYALTPSSDPDAVISVSTSGSGIGGITGAITPDDGSAPRDPPTSLQLGKSITITGLEGLSGSGAVLLYANTSQIPNSPIAAGYTSVQGSSATATLKAISPANLAEAGTPTSVAAVGSLIASLPVWTETGSCYVVLWSEQGMLIHNGTVSFTNDNANPSRSVDSFYEY